MRYSDHYGSVVSVMDTRNGQRISGRLIRVIPGVRITLETSPMKLENIRLTKRDIVDMNTATDCMTVRTKPKSEKQMKVEPLSESAYRAMESLLQSFQADQFDGLCELKLG